MALAETSVVTFSVFSTNTNGRSDLITYLWERDKLKFRPTQKVFLTPLHFVAFLVWQAKKKSPSLMTFLPTAKSETIFFQGPTEIFLLYKSL